MIQRRSPLPPRLPSRLTPPGAAWRQELAGVLVTQRRLASRVAELAAQIQKDYKGRDLVVVALLNGTVLFLADLIRLIDLPLRLDFIGVSSYGNATVGGTPILTRELKFDVKGRDVLIVDDILDTGRTLSLVVEKIKALQPRRLRVCVLLDKPDRRVNPVAVDYVGFTIPDMFVVGYGMDYAERYRNLPFVGVLKPLEALPKMRRSGRGKQ